MTGATPRFRCEGDAVLWRRPRTIRTLILAILMATGSLPIAAQPATLVGDLFPGSVNSATTSSNPSHLIQFAGSQIFFWAADEVSGLELWKSDGTAAGTQLVRDIRPGPQGQLSPGPFTVSGNLLFFAADDGVHGEELWKTDGTSAGTQMVLDIKPGSLDSDINALVDASSTSTPKLFVEAGSGSNFSPRTLLITNGTAAGTTTLMQDLNVQSMTRLGTMVIFNGAVGTSVDRELWKSDGTVAGTVRVKDINVGGTGSNPGFFAVLGSTAYFQAADAEGAELWSTNGTTAGTVRFAVLRPGAIGSSPSRLKTIGSRIFFIANDGTVGEELWFTNGTTTQLVLDIHGGALSSSPSDFEDGGGGLVIFNATDPVAGREVWVSNATAAGTQRLTDTAVGTAHGALDSPKATNNAGTVWFRATTSSGIQLFRTNGTPAGTVQASTFPSNTTASQIAHLENIGSSVYFSATTGSGNFELWVNNASGTSLVKEINPGRNGLTPRQMVNFGGKLFFAGEGGGTSDFELWKSDGTLAGTQRVGGSGSSPGDLTVSGDVLFFRAANALTNSELWKTDGTAAGTTQVANIHPTGSASPVFITNLNGTPGSPLVLFKATEPNTGSELWKSNGTTAGTVQVRDITTGVGGSDLWELTGGTEVVFSAVEASIGREIWKSNGTLAGTILLSDTAPGFASGLQQTSYITAVPTRGVFFVSDSTLWKTNLTPAGTVQVAPLATVRDPRDLTAVGTTLFFTGQGLGGIELWKSDGTAAGTVMVEEIVPGSANSCCGEDDFGEFEAVGSRLFFVVDDGIRGAELWKSDGTAATTDIVRDIFPGAGSSGPRQLFAMGEKLLFVADNGVNGAELWISDGTAAGTVMLQDLNPGEGHSLITGFRDVGDKIFFGANNQTNGTELWVMPVSAACAQPAVPVIVGAAATCAGESITLDAGAGYTRYLWSTGAMSRTIAVSPSATTTYSVTGYNAAGCPSPLATYTQTVHPNLTAVNVAFTGSTSTCSTGTGGTAQAQPNGGGPSTYQWYRRSVSGGAITVLTGRTGASYMLQGSDFPGAGNYFLVVATGPTCGPTLFSNEVAVSVVAPLSSVAINVSGSTSVCTTGTAGTATVSHSGGGTVSRQWGFRGTSGGAITFIPGQTGQTYQIRGPDFPAPGNYFLVSRVMPACGGAQISNERAVAVNAIPAPPTASSNGPICSGETLNLTASTVPGATYSWTGPSGFTSTQQNPSIPNATTARSGVYSVTATVSGCTSTAATTTVTVRSRPAPPTASNTGPACEGGSVTLNASFITGATYSWTGPGGFTSSLRNPTISGILLSQAGTYRVTSTVNGCESATSGATNVVVNANPSAEITAPGSIAAFSGASASVPGAGSGATYTWGISSGTITSGQGTRSINFTAGIAGTTTINVTVRSAQNCSRTGFVQIPVTQGSSSVTLTSSANPSTVGQPVRFTAFLSTAGGAPTGTVTFMESGVPVTTVPLAAGQAAFTTNTLSIGDHTLTAHYNGDSNFSSSSSAPVTQTVNNSPATETTLDSSPNPSTFGQQATFIATVTTVSGTPTGQVQFSDGATPLGASPLNGGSASFSTSALSGGQLFITATYSGDANFNPSTSSTLTHTVNKAATTTALASSPPSPAFGQPVTLTATVNSAAGVPIGTVTFKRGMDVLGSVALNNGAASFTTSSLGAGDHSMTAEYGSDSNFEASVSPVFLQTVSAASTSTDVSSSATNPEFGQTLSFTATVTSGAGTPGGNVTFRDDGIELGTVALAGGVASFSTSTLGAGSHPITAEYGGDANYAPSTSLELSQTIERASTSTALSSSTTTSDFGEGITFTATVSSAGGPPAGSVAFKEGATTLGTVTLSGNQAVFTTATLAVGTHTIVAEYLETANFASSTSPPVTQEIDQAASTVALTTSASPTSYNQVVTFTATVNPTALNPSGTVTFKEGDSVLGTGELSAGQTTFSISSLAAGTHSITAEYEGDGSFLSSLSPPLTQVVNKAAAAVTLTSVPNPSNAGQTVTFISNVVGAFGGTPGGNVLFKEGTTTLSDEPLASGLAVFTTADLSSGSHSITAEYSGDDNFNANTSAAITHDVRVGAPQVDSVSPERGSIRGGTMITLTGANFQDGATVTFDEEEATQVTVVDAETITLMTPPHSRGLVDIAVTNPGGLSATLVSGYRYGAFDPDGDYAISVTDAFNVINYLFHAAPLPPEGLSSLDADGDGDVDILDVFIVLSYLFGEGEEPV